MVSPTPLRTALARRALACLHQNRRMLRAWRIAALVPALALLSTPSVQGAAAQFHPAPIRSAPGQPVPTSMLSSKPIPQVLAAVAAARRAAPLPSAMIPDTAKLAQENTSVAYGNPAGCFPAYGQGVTSKICRLGDPSSRHLVAVLGDSHAGMWMPALIRDARAQGFAVVALDKPGCFLDRLQTNTAFWPCEQWYQWALQQDHLLHPAATLVTFELRDPPQATVHRLRKVLASVTRGVYIEDPPEQSQRPEICLPALGANMRRCSTLLAGFYRPTMRGVTKMLEQTHHPWLPTLQWFCAHHICPMVIDHIITTRDGDHFTLEYSAALAPVMGRELAPLLARMEKHT